MRRALLLIAVPLLIAAGCGDDDSGPPLLMLASTAGTAVLDGGTGELRELARGAAASPDGAILVGTTSDGSTTEVTAHDLANRQTRWTATVDGHYEARVASANGASVVLGPPRVGVPPAPGALAPGRNRTTLLVVRTDGQTQELSLQGNIEPEAFSLDGRALFVVDYQPAEAPTFYQVRRLDLESGELGDVFSVDAELQETMRGTARTQVWDPDGDRLYTLYTLDSGSAFVHVLDLDEQWAHCVDLPTGIGAASAGLALSDDGRSLYIADASAGGIAEVDTEELSVTEDGELPPTRTGEASVVGVAGRQLFVGNGRVISVIDRSSLEETGSLRTSGSILGLQVGDELYVALADTVQVLNRVTGELVRSMPVELDGGTVLSLGNSSIPTYAGIQCAC